MPHALEPKKRLLPSIRPRAHSVNLLEYADGRLLATWFTGSSEGMEDQVAVASVLHGQGNEWSAPVVTLRLFDHEGERWVPEQTCPVETDSGSTVMYTWASPLSSFRLIDKPDGRMWIRSIPESRPFRFRLVNGVAADLECLSGRNGLPEKGAVFQGQAMLREPGVGPTGGWLIPYHTEREPFMFHGRVLVVAGDGVTILSNEVDIYESPGCLEPALARLPDGRWLCYLRFGQRGDGFVWRAESSDSGRTFSLPSPTNLRNPHSAVDIAVGRSERLLVAYNDSHSLRTPLTVGISEDQGTTFRARDFETIAGEFSYPKLHQSADGVWRLFFTNQRECIAEVRFDEEWLLAGRRVTGL